MAYKAGFSLGATFTVSGGGAVTLNITGWNINESVNPLITTHTGTSGQAARIAGLLDVEGTIEANVDIAALPNAAAPGVISGAKGVVIADTGTTTKYSVPCLITRVNWASNINGLLTYNFNFALDQGSGTYTRPVT